MIWVQTLIPLAIAVVTVVGGGGLIKVLYIDKALARTQEQLQAAQAEKTATEGEVAVRAEDREWVALLRADAKEAREQAKAAEAEAREARSAAAQCAIDRDNDRDRLHDQEILNARLNGRVEELHSRVVAISTCSGGTPCPLRYLAPPALAVSGPGPDPICGPTT